MIKGVHLTNFEEKKKCSIEVDFSLMKKGIHIFNLKKASICHRTTLNSILNMSSCRKPEYSGQNSLTMLISSCFNNCSIDF